MQKTKLTLYSCLLVLAVVSNIQAQNDVVLSAQNDSATQVGDPEAGAQESKTDVLPISVSLNAEGNLTGKATTSVGGQEMPVEAKVTIVKDGVVVSSVVAKEDGSFAFPSVAPGAYNMYGSAATFSGSQPFTVVPGIGNNSGVRLGMSQYNGVHYGGFSGAPASSFGYGGGGYGGGGFGGGRFGGGGSGLRLLAIGGIAAGIALGVSDDDDASPDN